VQLVGGHDDLRLERAERAEQLALLAVRNLVLVERGDQILDQRRELVIDQVHASVR